MKAFSGTYSGTNKAGNSTSIATVTTEQNTAHKNSFFIHIFDHSLAAYFVTDRKFTIPDQVRSHPAIPVGGGCMVGCESYPFLIKVNGSGEFNSNCSSLNFTLHEYRKYVGYDDFVYFFDDIYSLAKQ